MRENSLINLLIARCLPPSREKARDENESPHLLPALSIGENNVGLITNVSPFPSHSVSKVFFLRFEGEARDRKCPRIDRRIHILSELLNIHGQSDKLCYLFRQIYGH